MPGRYPALVVRGENAFGHWDRDPAMIRYFESFSGRYGDPGTRSEAEHAAGIGRG